VLSVLAERFTFCAIAVYYVGVMWSFGCMNLLGLHNVFKLPLAPCGFVRGCYEHRASCAVLVYCVGVM
jgi:hypothetical protein